MSIFGKLKDMNEMRKQAGQIQSMLAQERITGQSKDGQFKVTIDGTQNVLGVVVGEEIVGDKSRIERSSREAFANALDQLKKLMVSKFSGMMGQ
jgi:DNA-binding protein YbaB